MEPWMWIVVGTVMVGFVAATGFKQKGGSFSKNMNAAMKGEVTPLVNFIAALPPEEQATRWDQAINNLWQAYERETAAKLVVEAVQKSEADILQYWLRQIMEVEPEIAQEIFTQDFLLAFFNPDTAKRCGKASCGCG